MKHMWYLHKMNRNTKPPFSVYQPLIEPEYLAKTDSLRVAEKLQREYLNRGIEVMLSSVEKVKPFFIFAAGLTWDVPTNPQTYADTGRPL